MPSKISPNCALATDAKEFITQELPRYMEHAGSTSNLGYCYATLGEYDLALNQLETRLRNRQYNFWWQPQLLEMFDPLQGDPRFEDLMQAFEDEMARQRANLDRLLAAENPEVPGA